MGFDEAVNQFCSVFDNLKRAGAARHCRCFVGVFAPSQFAKNRFGWFWQSDGDLLAAASLFKLGTYEAFGQLGSWD
jgi:hypothetical protein